MACFVEIDDYVKAFQCMFLLWKLIILGNVDIEFKYVTILFYYILSSYHLIVN